ncbi:MAG TPA: hypothetical protein VGI81_05375 [Tepidisphaeraceae bacterium]
MLRLARSSCAVLAAVAVLLVSATCTPAGCVLPIPTADSPVAAEPACCASHHHPAYASPNCPTQPKGSDPCPLCRTTLLVGKSVDANQHASPALTLLPTLFLPTLATADDQPPSTRAVPAAWGIATAHDPPTLFALHCALLN